MRSVIYLFCILCVMGLAFWAYRENYRTQAAIDEMRQVQREIGQMREDLGVLRAEWAYLNRPARLRDLVNLNFDRLRLVPIEAGQFVQLAQIDYPAPPPVPPKRPQARPQFISDRAAGLLVPASSEVQP
ncbi:MAG: cell division protein FtsL [Paracoccus sp. (in: a-proteobacteria)]